MTAVRKENPDENETCCENPQIEECKEDLSGKGTLGTVCANCGRVKTFSSK